MADSMRVKLTGLDPLVKKLKGMKRSVQNRILNRALRAGARPIITAARQAAPHDTGLTKKSLGMVLRRNRKRTSAYVVMGPRSDYLMIRDRATGGKTVLHGKATANLASSLTATQRLHVPAKVAHLVERGHGGPHAAGPHPFLRPALEGQKAAAESRMAAVIREELRKEAI